MDNIPMPENANLTGWVPTAADVNHCPLCKEKWSMYEEPGALGKVFLFCLKDMVSIWIRDPLLGRWVRVEEEPCPMCQEPHTRLFFRSDGYIKILCPKCKWSMENVDPDKHQAMMKHEEAMGLRKTFNKPKEKGDGLLPGQERPPEDTPKIII